jgi:ABC-type nickel/cobalt efflux system permease component RcnA
MATAIIIAVVIMLVASGPLAEFVQRFPTVKMLALSFLMLIGMTLIVRFALDSPLEESGFELMVPPRTERKWEGAGTHQHHLGRASELRFRSACPS